MQTMAQTCVIGFNKRDKVFYGSYRDPGTNKTKTKSIPRTVADEASARSWLINFESELHASVAPVAVPAMVTMRTLLPLWETHLKGERTSREGKPLDPRTIKKWVGCIKLHVLSHRIGDVPITNESFDPYLAIELVSALKQKLESTYYVRDCVLAARAMIGDARKKRWVNLYGNPFQDEMVFSEVPQASPLSGKNNPIHLSEDETKTLLTCEGSIPFARRVATLVALSSGLRIRELQGLAWKHIDLKARTIEVERQIVQGGESPIFKAPKKESFRTLPLHPLAEKALRAWRKHFPSIDPEGPVFPRNGSWDVYEMWSNGPASAAGFRADLRTAGLSDKYEGKHDFDFHATRRTFMTLLNNAGAPDEKVGALAGHAKSGVRRHYVKDHMVKFRPVIEMLPFDGLKLPWLEAA